MKLDEETRSGKFLAHTTVQSLHGHQREGGEKNNMNSSVGCLERRTFCQLEREVLIVSEEAKQSIKYCPKTFASYLRYL